MICQNTCNAMYFEHVVLYRNHVLSDSRDVPVCCCSQTTAEQRILSLAMEAMRKALRMTTQFLRQLGQHIETWLLVRRLL